MAARGTRFHHTCGSFQGRTCVLPTASEAKPCLQPACTFRRCPMTTSMSIIASWLCCNSLAQKQFLVNIRCIQEAYGPVKWSNFVTFRKHVIWMYAMYLTTWKKQICIYSKYVCWMYETLKIFSKYRNETYIVTLKKCCKLHNTHVLPKYLKKVCEQTNHASNISSLCFLSIWMKFLPMCFHISRYTWHKFLYSTTKKIHSITMEAIFCYPQTHIFDMFKKYLNTEAKFICNRNKYWLQRKQNNNMGIKFLLATEANLHTWYFAKVHDFIFLNLWNH